MSLYSILDYYPCGAYKLTKEGEETICSLYNNLSQIGAGNKNLSQLYKKGYITTGIEDINTVEQFSNIGGNNNYSILLLILILIIIIIIIIV